MYLAVYVNAHCEFTEFEVEGLIFNTICKVLKNGDVF